MALGHYSVTKSGAKIVGKTLASITENSICEADSSQKIPF